MAKVKIPKRIAGFKVPKAVRKSPLLKGLLGSALGRQILADALVAAAAAGAGALVADREEVNGATRKGVRGVALLGEAAERAAEAAIGVVTDTARSMLADAGKGKGGKRRASAREAGVRH